MKLLTIIEAASALGVSTQTIYNYISEGKLTKYRIGKNAYVGKKKVEKLLKPVKSLK